MMAFCYIIHSEKLNRFYTGASHEEDHDKRILKHNTNYYSKNNFTAKAEDWKLYLDIYVETYAQAIRIERKIKSMKSSTYIRNLKKYPELIHKLIAQTS